MTHSALRTAKLCLERAVSMKETADRFSAADEEWAAVCFFYSGYHTMKAAFIEDPVFDEPTRLSGYSTSLIPDDRYVTHHRGRMGSGPRKLGVNDIVQLIYPQVAPHYIRLHMASIAVRYENGLAPITLETVRADFAFVMDAYTKGELRAP